MRRINPNTNLPYERGDIRADGLLFKQYDLTKKDKNGFFYENWRNPKTINLDKQLKKDWYERNKELTKERARAWASANPEKRSKAIEKWREENREKHNATNRAWDAKNKPRKAALAAKRRAAQLQRTPNWVTEDEKLRINALYSVAAMYTRESGEEWHVDHQIPLQGKLVSGLHVYANLTVIRGSENVKKSNKFAIK